MDDKHHKLIPTVLGIFFLQCSYNLGYLDEFLLKFLR
jgi:hypothetical protein